MPPPLLALQDIALTFGATPLLRSAELSVGEGDRIALVGRNGAGKSTLLRIAAGLVAPDAGTRFLQPGATLRYLPQGPDLSGFASVRAYADAGLGPGDDPHSVPSLLGALGLTGEEEPARLSGGEARRAALARALAPRPDILLLDEPTNHLDLPAIEWLEETLRAERTALVVISHDRRFLERTTRAMVWLDRGTTRRLEQGFGGFEAWRDQVLAEEEAEAHKLGRKIAQEEHWVRYGVTARRKRNVRRMGELAALRERRRARVMPTGRASGAASEAAGSGSLVIAADDVTKRYGERAIVRGFTTRVIRGDRVGIVGPNGAGKTTLLGLLTGTLAPDDGSVRLGAGLAMVTLDQARASLDPEKGLADTLTGGGDTVRVGGQARHVMGYLKEFLFLPEQAGTPVGRLSGGEQARVMLARALAQPSNLLVLDEPTNDLDLETLDLLQEILADYSGTVLVVSHDRDLLDRVATSVIVSEGKGRWQEYAGGYTDMLAQRGAGVGARATPAPPRRRPEPRREEAPAAEGPAARRKLTFAQMHALKTLPGRIEALAAEVARQQSVLADAGLYARDRAAFDRASSALAKAQAEHDAAEEEWLALTLLAEEIDAS
jgi:ATP-binding cassette subfamily F protein uup